MKFKINGFLTLFLALVVQMSFAQTKTVTGTVTDPEGLPLPGVNILIKGSNTGTQSDFDGKYSILASSDQTLVFKYIGFETKDVSVGNQTEVNIQMVMDSDELDEVVVTAYGNTISKAKSNSSTVQLSSEGIENRPNVNVLNSLQGQAAGVNISSFSGQPGTNKIDVVIRGVASLSSSSDPLYVIDGVPLTQAFFRNLNANEIESVAVLKDAAATAIYGNRGSNGVIVITTKKGKYEESFSVGYSSSYGITDFIDDNYNMGSAQDQLRLQRKGFEEGVGVLGSSFAVSGEYLGGAITLDPGNLEAYDVNTDWQDIFIRQGTTQSHDVNITQGSKNFKSFTNIGYFEQDGIIPTTGFKRFNLRTNLSGKSIDEKFNYNLNLFSAFSRRNQLEQETRGGINNNVLQNPLTGYLTSSRFLPRGLYQSGQQLLDDFGNPALNLIPYMLLDLYGKNNAPSFFEETKTIATLNASYKITDKITVGTTTGADYADDRRVFAIGPEAYLSVVRASGANQPFHGFETISTQREFMFNHVNNLSYSDTFDNDHTLDINLYSEYLKAHRRTNFQTQTGLNALTWAPGAGTGYITYDPNSLPLSYRPGLGAFKANAGMFSYFGTIDYDYKGKYGFTSSIRRDATYRFVDDNKWGTFWSVSGRWNISEEDFLSDSSFIEDLKMRASYGTTGNQNVLGRGVDSSTSEIFLGSQLVRDLNSTQTGYNNEASFGVSSIANRDLVWETTTQFNVGIDYGLFKNRLTGAIDYYDRLTEDLFQNLPVSNANGITTLSSNDGSIRNSGLEFQGRFEILRDTKFKLSVNANFSYNKDEFENLGSIDTDGDGSFRPSDDFIRNIGGQLFEYNLVPYVGVNPANGNLLFLDINDNVTENVTDDDRRATGKSLLPTYQGGFGLNLEYGGFYLNSLFNYVADTYRFDSNYNSLMDVRNAGDFPVSNDLYNAWTPTNRITDVPALAANNIDQQGLSDRFLSDASYLRLRNLTIGYNFPQKVLQNTSITSLNLRLVAENYLTFTKWRGLDPERNVSGEAAGFYPTPKILTFGLDVKF